MQSIEVFRSLHKCWYPSCVGQASAAWIISPFASNFLLSVIKGQENKYVKKHGELFNNEKCKIKTNLFASTKFNDADKFKRLSLNNVSKNTVDFTRGEGAQSVDQWVTNQHSKFNECNVNIPTDTNYILANVCIFEILELPTRDEEFRVIVLVPNEEDLLNTLFRRLNNDGLAASFASVQPLFSVNTMLSPPVFTITSQTNIALEESESALETLVQYGVIAIDSKGVRAYVLTFLYSTESKTSRTTFEVKEREAKPYFFAITFKDLPIFSGQYIPSLI